MKLTTPRQLLDVVNFINEWMPSEETFQQMQEENS